MSLRLAAVAADFARCFLFLLHQKSSTRERIKRTEPMTGPKIQIRDFKLPPDVTGLAEAGEGEGGDDDDKGVVGHNGGEGVDAGSEVLGVFEFGGWETLEGEFVVSGAGGGGGVVFEFVVC